MNESIAEFKLPDEVRDHFMILRLSDACLDAWFAVTERHSSETGDKRRLELTHEIAQLTVDMNMEERGFIARRLQGIHVRNVV